MSFARRARFYLAGAAASAAFVQWDSTDSRGGVGLTRAFTATSTATLIAADYKLSLFGLEKDSPKFLDARAELHERSAVRLLHLCERNGGLYTKAGQFIGTRQRYASSVPKGTHEASRLRHAACFLRR